MEIEKLIHGRESVRRRIEAALDRLRNDGDWLCGGELNGVTSVDIHISIRGDRPTEITVEREILPLITTE